MVNSCYSWKTSLPLKNTKLKRAVNELALRLDLPPFLPILFIPTRPESDAKSNPKSLLTDQPFTARWMSQNSKTLHNGAEGFLKSHLNSNNLMEHKIVIIHVCILDTL